MIFRLARTNFLSNLFPVSILTRSEDRVLHAGESSSAIDLVVSILTRSEDRVLRAGRSRSIGSCTWFQSSPGPKTGCFSCTLRRIRDRWCFNPHPVRRPGASNERTEHCPPGQNVSILTRSEDRVLLDVGRIFLTYSDVSILTRSEDRVLRHPPPSYCHLNFMFQSSPGPKTGCFVLDRSTSLAAGWFQSSPGPKTGCFP